MFAASLDGLAGWVVVIGAFLLGVGLSPVAEVLIAKFMPRLGQEPATSTRITTAVLTGIICVAFALRFGMTWQLVAFIFFTILGVQLARIDVSLHLLPNALVALLLTGGLFLLILAAIFDQHTDGMGQSVLGAVILFCCYLILGLISPGNIGLGDVKLAAPIGLYLGYLGWSHLLFGGLLGFVLNGFVSLAAISKKAANRPAEVPHGPSMLGAAAAVGLLLP